LASFDEHIKQAKSNLDFLVDINSKIIPNHWDWEVTTCYYTAVHIINAHLAKVGNLHYKTHDQTKDAINPYNQLSPSKLPPDIYLAYLKLEGLSRRARYLCNEDPKNNDVNQFLTYDKHFGRAIKKLDDLIHYFKGAYGINLGEPQVACIELTAKSQLKFFKLRTATSSNVQPQPS